MTSPMLALTETDAVQETFLGEALEHAPIGAIVLDETGRYLAAKRRLTGYARGATRSGGLPHFVFVFWVRDPAAT
jgi:hypothetical protein